MKKGKSFHPHLRRLLAGRKGGVRFMGIEQCERDNGSALCSSNQHLVKGVCSFDLWPHDVWFVAPSPPHIHLKTHTKTNFWAKIQTKNLLAKNTARTATTSSARQKRLEKDNILCVVRSFADLARVHCRANRLPARGAFAYSQQSGRNHLAKRRLCLRGHWRSSSRFWLILICTTH